MAALQALLLASAAGPLACWARAARGPGAADWQAASPEEAGFHPAQLQAAASGVLEDLPGRLCWGVFRGGRVVHEEYYAGSTARTTFEGDSAMKFAAALVMGVAWTKGLFDLDRPLLSYGLPAGKPWPPDSAFYSTLTARHLLGQVGGMDWVAPGTLFTYSSGAALQKLEKLLAVVTGTNRTAQWATENFAVPMGMPKLFARDGKRLSVGGGQMVTCRDLARLGQLLLNEGRWHAADGTEFELISPDFINMMTAPSFPNVSTTYGFLLWLSLPNETKSRSLEAAGVEDPQCCYPRWGGPLGCSFDGIKPNNYHIADPNGTLLGDDYWPEYAQHPADVAYISLGWLTKVMIALPGHDIVIVSMGNTHGGSALCDSRYSAGNGDQAYLLAVFWRRARVLLMRPSLWATDGGGVAPGLPLVPEYTPPRQAPGLARWRRDRRRHNRSLALRRRRFREANSTRDGNTSGSCSCYCNPDQGFGSCFAASEPGDCESAAIAEAAAAYCPPLGVVQQCRVLNTSALASVLGLEEGLASNKILEDPCNRTHLVEVYNFSCQSLRTCSNESIDDEDPLARWSCMCRARAVACSYSAAPCRRRDLYLPRRPWPSGFVPGGGGGGVAPPVVGVGEEAGAGGARGQQSEAELGPPGVLGDRLPAAVATALAAALLVVFGWLRPRARARRPDGGGYVRLP